MTTLPPEYDAGKAALDELISWSDAHALGPSRNEAATRLHLIDQLLVTVLRWPRGSIHPEEPAGPGRIDYALGETPTQLIVEAKREGTYFELPAGTTTGVHTIDSLTSGEAGRPLREAIDQVTAYAARRGVGPSAVTNGHQLVVLLGARTDGVPPTKGRALVFPSLIDMRTEFRELWNNLSPIGIEQRFLYRTLRVTAQRAPDPLSSHLSGYPGTKIRNDLQAGLDILGELFLEDVARLEELRADFLRDCYASSGALSQYAEISRQILQTRYALLKREGQVDSAPVEDRKGLSPELTQDMLAAAASRRPIVLLGDVGAGKTTFIQRLVGVDAVEIFNSALTLYIDLGSSMTLTRLNSYVVDESITQLYDKYSIDIEEASFVEAVHNGALNRFDRGVSGKLRDIDPKAYAKERVSFLQRLVADRPSHLRASLEHLRSNRRKQIVVFLDNIDQRSSDDQEAVFLIANELASSWPATVFVTLRPETFYRSSSSGTLSGYQPRVFTIAPPRADILLQKRVDFALKQIRETGRLGSYPVGITVDSRSLTSFLEILAENFRSNDRLLALIDNLAGGNMRLALSFVTDFIGSGHANTRKMLDIYEQTGRYTIATHEFLRALLFGNGQYFSPEASPIANLFGIGRPDGREHFLLPLLLSFAQVEAERMGDEGFIPAEEFYRFGQGIGFDSDQVAETLEHALTKRLIEGAPRFSGKSEVLFYRITTVGAYTTRVLAGFFAYIDAVLVDTPIVDDGYRNLIQNVHILSERVNRAEYFRNYLNKQWEKLGSDELPWHWETITEVLAEDIRRVGRHADPATWAWTDSSGTS